VSLTFCFSLFLSFSCLFKCLLNNLNNLDDCFKVTYDYYQLTNLAWSFTNAPQTRLFFLELIKLLINTTLFLTHPASQAFSFPIMLHLILFVDIVFSYKYVYRGMFFNNKVDLSQERSVVILRKKTTLKLLLKWAIFYGGCYGSRKIGTSQTIKPNLDCPNLGYTL